MRCHRRRSFEASLAAALLIALPACAAAPATQEQAQPQLGLFGTIPIYWGEPAGMGEALSGGSPHWARAQLERDYRLEPLDVLDDASLKSLRFVLLAQPRALSPAENVALDAWVRRGGRLLLFADPLLTGESHFSIGDRRRPQDVILLSPLLAHWGLELEFVEDQPAGVQSRDFAGTAVPLNLPGRFVARSEQGACALEGEGVLARCRLGAGHVTLLADAALLDIHEPNPAAAAALDGLLTQAFAGNGDDAGN